MSNYTQATDFSAKDNLASGNAAKVIKGSEVDSELSAIATAVSSKADSGSGDVPSGSIMLFVATTVPTGWSLVTTWDAKSLVLNSSITSSNAYTTGGNWSLNIAASPSGNLPNHTHGAGNYSVTIPNSVNNAEDTAGNAAAVRAQNVALGGVSSNPNSDALSLTTNLTGNAVNGNWRPAYLEVIACSKD